MSDLLYCAAPFAALAAAAFAWQLWRDRVRRRCEAEYYRRNYGG